MYGNPATPAETCVHLGNLAAQGLLNDAALTVKARLRALRDEATITGEELAEAMLALHRWMADRPEDEEELAWANQFYDEYEGSSYSYLPSM